jgi:putative Mg2+ transporter-C (MgtC) family protein
VDLSIAIKLVIAAALGGVIGIERQIRGKPAGLRTNMLICMGATLFMVISLKMGDVFGGGERTRIAAQIITGIGFLGAGAVLHSHGFVMGLTTAATIWVVAGVGMAIGAGMYGAAIAATVLAIITLYLLGFLEGHLEGRSGIQLRLVVEQLSEGLEAVHRVLQAHGLTAVDLGFKREGHHYRLWFHIAATRETIQEVLNSLGREPMIHEVETEAEPIGTAE